MPEFKCDIPGCDKADKDYHSLGALATHKSWHMRSARGDQPFMNKKSQIMALGGRPVPPPAPGANVSKPSIPPVPSQPPLPPGSEGALITTPLPEPPAQPAFEDPNEPPSYLINQIMDAEARERMRAAWKQMHAPKQPPPQTPGGTPGGVFLTPEQYNALVTAAQQAQGAVARTPGQPVPPPPGGLPPNPNDPSNGWAAIVNRGLDILNDIRKSRLAAQNPAQPPPDDYLRRLGALTLENYSNQLSANLGKMTGQRVGKTEYEITGNPAADAAIRLGREELEKAASEARTATKRLEDKEAAMEEFMHRFMTGGTANPPSNDNGVHP